MNVTELEWILARFRNYCETLCIAGIRQLLWSQQKQRRRVCIV